MKTVEELAEEYGFTDETDNCTYACNEKTAFEAGYTAAQSQLEQENARLREQVTTLQLSLQVALVTDDERVELLRLKAECNEWERLANEWREDYDKLKNKYEPMFATVSEIGCDEHKRFIPNCKECIGPKALEPSEEKE